MNTETPVIGTAAAPRAHRIYRRGRQKVGELIREEDNPELKLRVFISGGGCSGFQYGFTFDDEVEDGDSSVENQGVTLLVDPMSFQYLMGAEIDYKEDLQGAQFVIRNPNATDDLRLRFIVFRIVLTYNGLVRATSSCKSPNHFNAVVNAPSRIVETSGCRKRTSEPALRRKSLRPSTWAPTAFT